MNRNQFTPPHTSATSEQLDQLKKLVTDSYNSDTTDVLRPVFEYAATIQASPQVIGQEAGPR